MDTLESGVSGCLFPSLIMGGVAWYQWESRPKAAHGILAFAAIGFCYGLSCLIRAWRRNAREEAARKQIDP